MRPATLIWTGDGGFLAFNHGMYEFWCEVCALEVQVAHARDAAARLPELEQRLAALLSEPK